MGIETPTMGIQNPQDDHPLPETSEAVTTLRIDQNRLDKMVDLSQFEYLGSGYVGHIKHTHQ